MKSADLSVALLRLIAESTYIDQVHIFGLVSAYGVERTKSPVHRALQKMVRNGLILRTPGDGVYHGVVYSITQHGLSVLEHSGNGFACVSSDTEVLHIPTQILHHLVLNKLRIKLRPVLGKWRGDREVRSLQILGKTDYAKDYDAVVQVNNGVRVVEFGIEYERTLKAPARYAELANVMKRERKLSAILYLTDNDDYYTSLAWAFKDVPLFCIARVSAFLNFVPGQNATELDVPVTFYEGSSPVSGSLRSLLKR